MSILKKTFIITVFLLSHCSHVNVEHQDPPYHDKAYFPKLKKETRKSSLHTNFETIYTLKATYFNNTIKTAFQNRKNKILPGYKTVFDDLKKNQINFIISIFTPLDEIKDLEEMSQWSLFLQKNNQNIKAASIKELNKEDHWGKFFPYITAWSKEYLVTFEIPEKLKDLDVSKNFSLILSSTKSKTTLTW